VHGYATREVSVLGPEHLAVEQASTMRSKLRWISRTPPGRRFPLTRPPPIPSALVLQQLVRDQKINRIELPYPRVTIDDWRVTSDRVPGGLRAPWLTWVGGNPAGVDTTRGGETCTGPARPEPAVTRLHSGAGRAGRACFPRVATPGQSAPLWDTLRHTGLSHSVGAAPLLLRSPVPGHTLTIALTATACTDQHAGGLLRPAPPPL
jgi:hypothetical protein